MIYREEKDTVNPFLEKLTEKYEDLVAFEGDSIVEVVVKTFTNIIMLIVLVVLIPIGIIISIYNTLYNLQKKTYDNLMEDDSSSRFALSVELGIYILLSIPCLLILIPYWIMAAIITWMVKHKILALFVIIIAVLCYVYRDRIVQMFETIMNNIFR